MKRLVHLIFVLTIVAAWVPARAQSAARISLLNKNGQAVTSIVDGNQVSLKIELDQEADADSSVDFLLSGMDVPVASCTIRAGDGGCESDSLSALGWYWGADGSAQPQREVTARVNGGQLEGSLIVAVAPRPVVMVHGFNSNYEAWKNYVGPNGYLASVGLHGYAVGDGQVEGVMDTGSLANPNARTNTIAQNAAILGEYIDNVQAATGAERVDLLVHSMGGMISRYYLDRVMADVDVAQLIILGTPMAGSNCSALPASLGILLPATLEIQPSYMAGVFNQQIYKRRGVPFHALAGTALRDDLESPCTPAPSDLVVTVDSVKAIPMPVEEMSLLHTDLNLSAEVFEGFVKRLLQTPPGNFEALEDPLPGSVAIQPVQFTKIYTGHLDLGETEDVVINIDPNVTVANFALYDTTRTLDITVVGASGNAIVLDPAKNGIVRVTDPSTMIYLGYGFREPKPGKWVVTLHTTADTPAEGADYAITARFNGGATLQATTSTMIPRLNESVTITANLSADGGPVSLQTAQTLLRQPDGSLETLEMSIDGDTAAVDVTPNQTGIYGVEVSITASAQDDMAIDRAVFLTFEVQPSGETAAANRLWVLLGLVLVVGLVGMVIVMRRQSQASKSS